MAKTRVLVCTFDQAHCDLLRQLLDGQPDLEVTVRLCPPEVSNPLEGVDPLPDVLISLPGARWAAVLESMRSLKTPSVPTIVIGADSDMRAMREAMHAGARDYFAPPLPRVELLQAVRLIGRERVNGNGNGNGAAANGSSLGQLVSVISAKGGSGASMIACNLAHVIASATNEPVALIDLDLQFGALPLALDIEQSHSLLDALASAPRLDAPALQGYMSKHASGVHVLSAMADEVPMPWNIETDALARVLKLARQKYRYVVVDLPRQIDPLTTTVMSHAQKILVVMQQSLAHVRNAKRMVRVLTRDLAVNAEAVTVIVNRYDEAHAVRLADIQETVRPHALVTVPNAFREVSSSMDGGLTLMQVDRHGAVIHALGEIAEGLGVRLAEAEAPPRKRSLRDVLTRSFGA